MPTSQLWMTLTVLMSSYLQLDRVHASDSRLFLPTASKPQSLWDFWIMFNEDELQSGEEREELNGFTGENEQLRQKRQDCTPHTAHLRSMMGREFKRSIMAENREQIFESEEIAPHKRSAALPWECTTNYKWIDLGQSYYPRFLRTADCGGAKRCMNLMYSCKPRFYGVKVLKRLVADENDDCNTGDALLPDSLRRLWKFHNTNVTVFCECGY